MAEPQEGMAEWPTGRLLASAARLVEHAWAEALEQRGLTHAGLIVLHLLDVGPLSQTDLAARARVETQTMSRTIERLEREGLISRTQDAADRRRHVVTRTESGKRAWAESRTLEAEVFPEVASSEELRATLLDIIRTASENRWSEQ